jgi:hypothetical protein
MTYCGISFCQSTYGNVSTFFLEVLDLKSADRARIETELGTPFQLPGDQGERAWILDFRENMKIPKQMLEMKKFDREDLGPALQIGIFSPGKGFGDPFWVLRGFPELEETRGGSYHFTFERLVPSRIQGSRLRTTRGVRLSGWVVPCSLSGSSFHFIWIMRFHGSRQNRSVGVGLMSGLRVLLCGTPPGVYGFSKRGKKRFEIRWV